MYETKDNKVFVISNVPYTRCDWFFSSEADLLEVFSVLDDRCQKTNYDVENYAKFRKNYKDIYLIIDEAHRYFDSRSSLLKGNNIEKMNNVLTQCRKRNIRIVAITQRLSMIDIRFRRLADYVEEYKRWSFLGLYWVKHSVYENRGDLADIETDNTVRIASDWSEKTLKNDSMLYSEFFAPLTMGIQLFSLCSSSYRRILKEYYNTYYICALTDVNVNHYSLEEFDRLLFVPDYIAKLENVVEIKNYSKKLSFDKARSKIATQYQKVWSKIIDFLDTAPKDNSFENSVSDIKSDYQKTLNDLKNSCDENWESVWQLYSGVLWNWELSNSDKMAWLDNTYGWGISSDNGSVSTIQDVKQEIQIEKKKKTLNDLLW